MPPRDLGQCCGTAARNPLGRRVLDEGRGTRIFGSGLHKHTLAFKDTSKSGKHARHRLHRDDMVVNMTESLGLCRDEPNTLTARNLLSMLCRGK